MKAKHAKGVRCHGYRLSPNEEARILQEETEKRRKLRLLQVRELSKQNAAHIRQSVKAEKQKQIQKLAKKVEKDLECVKEEKLKNLQARYDNSMRTIGKAHKEAELQEDRTEELLALAEESNRKAELRYKEALEALQAEKEQQQMDEKYHILARKAALEVERTRASQIASLPPPPPDPTLNINKTNYKPVKMTDATAFSLTHFHMAQDVAVEREDPELQADARVMAVQEEERIQEEQRKIKQGEQERRERARVRHNLAREKELLKQDYAHMLHDLSDLQRADMCRRQKVVADIPKQVFEPPHRRMEDRRDRQRTMEQAFEDMYMKATDYTGNLSLALDPYPQMDTPTATEASEASVMSDADHTHRLSISQTDKPRPPSQLPRSEILKDVTNVAKDSLGHSPKKSETVLKKLFNQIKNQRDDWITRSSQEAPEPEDVLSMSPHLFKKYQGKKEGPVDTLPHTDQDDRIRHMDDGVPKTLASPSRSVAGDLASPPKRSVPQAAEELSPPVKEHQSFPATGDMEPSGKLAPGVTKDAHERCVEEARRELEEIQEKKSALEEKLRQYAIQQQQEQQVGESVAMRSDDLDKQLQEQLHAEKCVKDVDDVDSAKFSTNAHPRIVDVAEPRPKILEDDVDTASTKTITRQAEIKETDQKGSELSGGESGMSGLNVLSEALTGGVESDHIRRIREYQQRLLERHQSWKRLSESRADIEQRRNELRQRYPQLNIPPMEKLPVPTAGSLSLLSASRNFLPTLSTQPSQDPLARSAIPLAQPVSAVQTLRPHPTGFTEQVISSVHQSSGAMVSKCATVPASALSGVTMPTTDSTVLQANVVSSKISPSSKPVQPKTDNVRKQLLFDSETPQTSPEKSPKSPLIERKDVKQVVLSENSELPPSGAVRDYPRAVPLGQSRVRKTVQVSPAGNFQSEDNSLDHSGVDPILALTEAAKERKLYFEKRQMQLTQQLKEIQDRKAAYLSQHEDSQRKLQEHRQRVLQEIIQGFPPGTLDDATGGQTLEIHRSSSSVGKSETGTSHQDLPQNVSLESTSSRGHKTWADLLHDEIGDADTAPVDPESLLNDSQGAGPNSHRPHELSTILEVDTPPQSKSLSASHRKSEDESQVDGVLTGHHPYTKDTPGGVLESARKTDVRFSSQRSSVPLPPSYEDVNRMRGHVHEDDLEEGYEPFASGLVLRKSDDLTMKTVSEASAAVTRAHELLAKTAIAPYVDSGAKLYDNQSSTSDLVSAVSGSQSHISAEMLFSKPDLKDSSSNISAWRTPDIYEVSSPHSSELTQYTAPSESAQSNGSEAVKSTDSLTQYTAYSNGESWGNGIVWRSKDRHISPSGASDITQYSGASGISQDSTGKGLRASEVPGDSGKSREMDSADGQGRHVDKVKTFSSPSELELTQFSHSCEKPTSQDGPSHTEITGSRPKSSASVSGSELTQYSCSPPLELNSGLEIKGGKQVNASVPVPTESQMLENGTESAKNFLNRESLHSAKPLTERHAVTSAENMWSSDLTQYSATSIEECWRRSIEGDPQKNSSLNDVSKSANLTSPKSNLGDKASLGPIPTELGSGGVQIPDRESLKQVVPSLDLSQKSEKDKRDIFRAVKVFIEPPNSQSSPQGTERSGRDRTRGSSISQSLGMDERSGPSETSSYMTLPAMSRANPLAMADFSTLVSHVPGEFRPKADSFETFGSSGYQPLSDDSWKTPGMSSHHEDSLATDLRKWKDYLQLGSPDKSQISLSEPGITDEAELTLVSCASLTSPSRLHDSQSESLVSFERHEASMDDFGLPTPWQKSDYHHGDIILYLEPGDKTGAEKQGLTLQQALLAKRKGFVSASERRVLEAKEKARSSKEKPRVEPAVSGLTKTLASWKKSRAIRAPSKPSPGKSLLSQKSKTTPDRKKQEKETVERTKRLYNQLEEVKERNLMKEREKQYAANRDRAKQYHKKMQENLKKQRASKK